MFFTIVRNIYLYRDTPFLATLSTVETTFSSPSDYSEPYS